MIKLQDFRFNKSRYERPNQKKICGWSVYGKPCQIGPDANGECQGHFECVPAKKGDRWNCTRAAENGGKCESGPNSSGICQHRIPRCVPVNSIRAKRGQLTLISLTFLFLILVVFSAGQLSDTFFSPGDLITKHHFKNGSCDDCHGTDSLDTNKWLAAGLSSGSSHAMSEQCVSCHSIADNIYLPHNVSKQRLEAIKNSVIKSAQLKPEQIKASANPTVLCNTCHKEHKGSQAGITHITKQQCETCHVTSHPDFLTQHLEFKDYPAVRRTFLIFDHAKHLNKHFKKEELAQYKIDECSGCHKSDQAGLYMQTTTFEKGCESCHERDVTGGKLDQKHINILALPAIDVPSLSAKGFNIGQWPAGMEDQEISPILLYLASQDFSLVHITSRITNNTISLYDLGNEDEATLRQVADLIWKIKRIFMHLNLRGSADLDVLFNKKNTAATLFNNLDISSMQIAVKKWFPNLTNEIERLDNNLESKTQLIRQPATTDKTANPGNWLVSDFSLQYRPKGHNDKLMHDWMELSLSAATTRSLPLGRVYAQFSYNKLSGQCSKCHSIDVINDKATVNWEHKARTAFTHSFTKYNHETHFKTLKSRKCVDCHAINNQAKYSDGFKNNDPFTFASSFKPIKKATCSKCHSKKEVGDDCTTCHNYHTGEMKLHEKK